MVASAVQAHSWPRCRCGQTKFERDRSSVYCCSTWRLGDDVQGAAQQSGRARARGNRLELLTDVLVIGGGPAGAWAALTARAAGCDVVLVDKGFFGTSGATAPSNTETWVVPPASRASGRSRAIAPRPRACATMAMSSACSMRPVAGSEQLADWAYPFPVAPDGTPYLGNLRGPDYMRFLRRRVIGAGVQVLDHHPALELIGGADGISGAAASTASSAILGLRARRPSCWRPAAARSANAFSARPASPATAI